MYINLFVLYCGIKYDFYVLYFNVRIYYFKFQTRTILQDIFMTILLLIIFKILFLIYILYDCTFKFILTLHHRTRIRVRMLNNIYTPIIIIILLNVNNNFTEII